MSRLLSRAIVVLVAICLSGCLFYDSRWGQAETEQRNNAKHYAPSTLKRGEGAIASARAVDVRVYATPSYAAHTVAWKEQFEKTVRDANPILASSLGVKLVITEARVWKPTTSEDDLAGLNAEISRHDPGDDVGWVIGLVGSVPRFSMSFDQIGNGVLRGKHIVLRAAVAPSEIAAFERALPDLDATEREELVRKRRSHKEVGVLLHELGHTLGALHRTEGRTIMSPAYDRKMSAFDEVTLRLMKMELQRRLVESPPSPLILAKNRLRVLESTDRGWVPAEYQHETSRLRRIVARESHAPTSPVAASNEPHGRLGPPSAGAGTSALQGEDRAVYQRALEQEQAGDAKQAWRTALRLFDAYVGNLDVQELRCRLAKKRGASALVVGEHCKVAEQLRGGASEDPR